MARLREEVVGWLYTVSGLSEKSFPIGIKNVSIKELVVIFPLVLLAISFAFKDIIVSFACLTPVIFVIFYEEKSTDEFQYVYYFIKFYLKDFMKPSETKAKEERKSSNVNIMKSIRTYIDYGLLGGGALMSLASLPNVVKIFEFASLAPDVLLRAVILFGIGTGIAVGETIYLLIKTLK